MLTFNVHIKTADQQIKQYGDWYGRRRMGCYVWYSGPAQSPPRCTKCNGPPVNGQCTNFILFAVTL